MTRYSETPQQGFLTTGVRLGGDLDVVQWYRSRAGLDMDYDQYSPIFSEAIRTQTASGASR